jgi:hypothetical protein
VGPKPPRETRWTFDDDDGPMWTRAFRDRGRRPKDAPSRKTIRAILERLGAERIVLGHSPTDDGSIVLDHPHYGGSVVLIDTRISDRQRGRLGALAIEGDVLRPVYADDRADGDGLREREAREAAKPEGLVHRVLAKLGDIFKGGRRR